MDVQGSGSGVTDRRRSLCLTASYSHGSSGSSDSIHQALKPQWQKHPPVPQPEAALAVVVAAAWVVVVVVVAVAATCVQG